MATTKTKFAALTAGLLARKGEALPSAHSAFALASAYDEAAHPPERAPQKIVAPHDLGALIERAKPQGVTAIATAVSAPQRAAPPSPAPEAVPVFGLRGIVPQAQHHEQRAPAPHRRSVTVRLDDARYLRLKLHGWRFHRTSQDILTRALDAYLTAIGAEEVQEEDLARWRAQGSGPTAA